MPRARVLDGRALAKRMEATLKADVAEATTRHGRPPGLAVVLVGADPASEVYVGRKRKACRRIGIHDIEHRLPAETSQEELVALVDQLNADDTIDGILIQLPLPPHIKKGAVLQRVSPDKDVDAFHAQNIGHALIGDESLAPCTPQGVLLLLDEADIDLRGKEVVVINHSNLVGKPLAAMLINRDATVTVCHKHTADLAAHTRRADIVVSGTGVPELLRADHVKEGAVVIDVGIIRRDDGSICGDAAADVWDKAAWVTPVPGGVGPMTIAVLLQNTVRAFERHTAS